VWRKVDKNLLLLSGGLIAGILIGVIVLFGLRENHWLGSTGNPSGANNLSASSLIGLQAPGFELASLTGHSLKLEDYKGIPVVINFWATWCAPCKEEMPVLQDRYKIYGHRFAILAVNFEEEPKDVQPYIEKLKLTFPILLDSQGKAADLYHVIGMPTTFFLDKDGIVRAMYIGTLSEKKLDDYLKKIGVIDG